MKHHISKWGRSKSSGLRIGRQVDGILRQLFARWEEGIEEKFGREGKGIHNMVGVTE